MATFDKSLARLLLEICRYTYAASFGSGTNPSNKDDAESWINNHSPGGLLKLLKGGPTSVACVAAFPDKNVVAYMGTKTEFHTGKEIVESMLDWANNLKAEPVPFKLSADQLGGDLANKDDLGGRVHKGFLAELSAIQAEVIQELLQHDGKTRPLYVTGHSQGGAEAALATRAFLAGGFPVAATYSFAAPRAGDLKFVESIPASLPFFRIEFGDDIVPHVPPRVLSQELQNYLQYAETLPFLPDEVKKGLQLLKHASAKISYMGAGRLCYGSHRTKALRINISAADEARLFESRLTDLVMNSKHWAEHHYLAGTMAEVKQGKKGNYTVLVSDFPTVS